MDKITFTNSLENMRTEILNYFYLIQLKDRHGHLWDIQEISIDVKSTTLYLGNENTDNFSTCIISDCINDLDEYEVVLKNS